MKPEPKPEPEGQPADAQLSLPAATLDALIRLAFAREPDDGPNDTTTLTELSNRCRTRPGTLPPTLPGSYHNW